MSFSPELLQQLIATFQSELDEGALALTNGLVELEKTQPGSEERKELIEKIMRTAHNIKGASRGLGISNIGEITHHIEAIFMKLKSSDENIPKSLIDTCLDAVDKLKDAMQAFLNKSEINFDLQELLHRLETCDDVSAAAEVMVKPKRAENDKVMQPEPAQVATDSVRVPLKIIDRLSELSEEIQSSKIQLDDNTDHAKQLNKMVEGLSSTWRDIHEIVKQSQEFASGSQLQKLLNRANDDLTSIHAGSLRLMNDLSSQVTEYARLSHAVHEEVAHLRLVPANNYFAMLPRYVRELGQSLNKNVDLEIRGGEVYLDKYVLEGLKDPINHILRNSIDHGIEDAATRASVNKPEIATVTITVRDAGGKVYVDIRDDGAGLNYDRIRQKLKSLGPEYAAKAQQYSEEELQEFIFQAGFSTKSDVTSISGRGVGMDVVKKNIQALKGSITLTSRLGEGTTITLCVPVSLTSERGLMVGCDEQVYVLPTASIERVLTISRSDLVKLEGRHAILIDGHPVLLQSLSQILGGATSQVAESFAAVVLKSANTLAAFSVDTIFGEREIVIKPIHEPLSSVPCIAGATLLDRKKIAIVLNPYELIGSSMRSSAQFIIPDQQAQQRPVEAIRILVVDDSITTRTLEKNILESKNYHVTTAVNGQEAWDILQKQKFALMITDVNMPVMDGFELTEKVKKSEHLAAMPVIIITSLGSDAEKARGVDVGADAYIVKNEFESGALLQVIEQLV